MSWICAFGCVGSFLVAAAAAFLVLLAGPSGRTEHQELPCPACSRVMRFKVRVPDRIRCSCGNVMPVPEGAKSAKCPGCCDTIHVAIRKPTRVRCKCGNVSRIPK